MKYIPFAVIKAAKENDIEAAEKIKNHFYGYILSRCMRQYRDTQGFMRTYIDEDLRYLAETALYEAIFTFQFKEPPEDFTV